MNTTGRGVRLAVVTAIAGTILIALGAFWLSFTALADLARRSGISTGQAWAWPLIVDGIIVVATVAVVALAGQRTAWYPWGLLIGGAMVSVTANAIHAVLTADTDLPALLAASVAAVPPVVLLAITHLTMILTRTPNPGDSPDVETAAAAELLPPTLAARLPELQSDSVPAALPAPGEADDRYVRAAGLRKEGWSNKRIARDLGVHPSTVGRWFTRQLTKEEEPGGPPARVEEARTP